MKISGRLPNFGDPPSFIHRCLELVDTGLQLIKHRNCEGMNPAIAAVYAPLRSAILVITGLISCTLLFGILVPIESAAIAHGRIVLLGNNKTVQHLEGGIIRDILVKEGDKVKEGQPLLEMSDIAPQANRAIVRTELLAAQAVRTRIQALQNGKDEIQFPKELTEQATQNVELQNTLTAQSELFATQQRTQSGKLDTLKQRIIQLEEEIQGLKSQVKSADGQLTLINEEISTVETLHKKGHATKPRLLALKRERESVAGNRGQYQAGIAKAQQAILEMNMNIMNLENEFATALANELHETQSKIADFEEKLRAASDIVERTVITAPSEGIITGLKYHTLGGVIPAGEPILDIVPQDDSLVIEARVRPSDIDVVHEGLEAKVLFSAYKSRNIPRLHGKVTRVSADAFTDERSAQQESYYLTRIEVDAAELSRIRQSVHLYPGMPADIFIRTGSRSFLSYLLAPVTDSMRYAFREE